LSNAQANDSLLSALKTHQIAPMSNSIENWSDAEKTHHIRKVVTQAGVDLRERHPWLKHQNVIGMTIMILSLAGMVASGWLYAVGTLPWWACIPLVAFFASFIHELEHDLIHLMYFRTMPRMNRFLLILGWLARPSTVNPLVRRELHLHHHKYSGTESDLEERAISNGDRWSWRRLLILGDNMFAIYFRPSQTVAMINSYSEFKAPKTEKERAKMRRMQYNSYQPIGTIYYIVWHGLIVYYLISMIMNFLGSPIIVASWAQPALEVLNFLVVAWFLPSTLRTFSLHFISSNMHYYGDVERGNIMQQTQVLNAWWLFPLQLFCCNFGSTHAIHHFVVKEPFYIRQWTAKKAHKVMKEMGVRFNDFGTFKRANRFFTTSQAGDAQTVK